MREGDKRRKQERDELRPLTNALKALVPLSPLPLPIISLSPSLYTPHIGSPQVGIDRCVGPHVSLEYHLYTCDSANGIMPPTPPPTGKPKVNGALINAPRQTPIMDEKLMKVKYKKKTH